MNTLDQWAAKWGISAQALDDLRRGISPPPANTPAPTSETAASNLIRLECAKHGIQLWRNNRGAAIDQRGVPVRYGLLNDSAALNKKIKSSDLIGLTRRGQFVAVEVKAPGWSGSMDGHTKAQEEFLALVRAHGGIGLFATEPGAVLGACGV